jgi:uncharacterized phage protein (TIGR01671 family)
MNREIKFRVWDTTRKQWVENYSMWMIDAGALTINELFQAKNVIFQQCTGLKDRHGKEIYEGDIVKTGSNQYFICIYNNTEFIYQRSEPINPLFAKQNKLDTNLNIVSFLKIIHNLHLPIVGNIFENPELLK